MSHEELKQKIRSALKTYFAAEDYVDVSDGLNDNVHVVVVSRKFDGKRMREKHDLLWSILTQQLTPAEWGNVTLTIGLSPEDVKMLI